MQSASNAMYQRAFAREPLPFCSRCHAPEGDPSAPSTEAIALGTACVTCHVAADGSMRTRSCEGCHEFAYPDGVGMLQLTATEHRASIHASTTCVECHMPRGGTHAAHRFGASRDPEMLRRAAWITAERRPDAIVIAFAPRDVGHALPTGDIFRRLRVTVAVAGDDASRREVVLGRRTKQGEERDDRPFLSGAAKAVSVPIVAPGRAIVWRVDYERVEHPTSADETEALIEGAIELASGTL